MKMKKLFLLSTLNLEGVASIDKELIFNTDNSASLTNTHSVGRGPTNCIIWLVISAPGAALVHLTRWQWASLWVLSNSRPGELFSVFSLFFLHVRQESGHYAG